MELGVVCCGWSFALWEQLGRQQGGNEEVKIPMNQLSFRRGPWSGFLAVMHTVCEERGQEKGISAIYYKDVLLSIFQTE
jgi:hypothetical protein